jgi:hypothetical protein
MAQKLRATSDVVSGDVDEGYGKVADAFRRNLSSGQEVGAAVAGSSICGVATAMVSRELRGSRTRSSMCSGQRKTLPRLR